MPSPTCGGLGCHLNSSWRFNQRTAPQAVARRGGTPPLFSAENSYLNPYTDAQAPEHATHFHGERLALTRRRILSSKNARRAVGFFVLVRAALFRTAWDVLPHHAPQATANLTCLPSTR